MTGVSFYDVPITGKRLALLLELVPKAELIAWLQDPNSGTLENETREIETTARAMGRKILTVKARSDQEISAAFTTIASRVLEHSWLAEVRFLMAAAVN